MTESVLRDSRFILGFSASAWPELTALLLVGGVGTYLTHVFASGWTALAVLLGFVGVMRVGRTEVCLKSNALVIRGLGGFVQQASVIYSDIHRLCILRTAWSPALLVILINGEGVRIGPFDSFSFLGRRYAFRMLCHELVKRSGISLEYV